MAGVGLEVAEGAVRPVRCCWLTTAAVLTDVDCWKRAGSRPRPWAGQLCWLLLCCVHGCDNIESQGAQELS